jgi:GT2 family glycosyltransferase
VSGPQVTVVIVTYNSQDHIRECLAGLRPGHERGLLRCVVVDNTSADATPTILDGERSWITAIAAGGNLGFGRGCNVGLARASTPYVLFLNPDAVLDPGALTTLLQFMEGRPQAGIAGPAIVEAGEHLQAAGPYTTPRTILSTALGRSANRSIRPGDPPRRVGWVCGAALLARTELVRRLGGFDPRFFLYFEETDLCRRAQAAGGEVWAIGQAVARHVSAASTAGTSAKPPGWCIPRHYFQSRYYYLCKHHGRLAAIATEAAELALLAAYGAACRLRGKRDRRFVDRLRAPMFSLPVAAG